MNTSTICEVQRVKFDFSLGDSQVIIQSVDPVCDVVGYFEVLPVDELLKEYEYCTCINICCQN